MKETVITQHKEYLSLIDGLFSDMRTLLVGQESALSRLVLASLSARPQTVQKKDGTEEFKEPSVVSSCSHIRLIGPPGIGKTHLASSLALMLACDFARIECTPDKQPSDIIGGPVLIDGGKRSVFMKGPLLNANVVLADEITNATPRTQRSLLAGLSEDFIWASVMNEESESKRNKIPLCVPFFFMATQNPLSEYGTYPMPRAVLDRFSMTLRFRHLQLSELITLQEKNEKLSLINGLVRQRLGRQIFMALREFIFTEIKVPSETSYFISFLVRLLDPSARDENDSIFSRIYSKLWEQRFDFQNRHLVEVGKDEIKGAQVYRLSDFINDALIERAVLFLRYLGKSLAFTKNSDHDKMREYVIPSDIIKLYPDVMLHRIGLTNLGENFGGDEIINFILRYVTSTISNTHWFFAELPKAARKTIGS